MGIPVSGAGKGTLPALRGAARGVVGARPVIVGTGRGIIGRTVIGPAELQQLGQLLRESRERRSPAAVPAGRKRSGKEWVPIAFERRRDELLAMGITGASQALANESETVADCAKPLRARYIERLLRAIGAFRKARRR